MTAGAGGHPYLGARMALATKHDKGRLFAGPLADYVGAEVIEVAFDTDVFGTFAGDIARTLTAQEAAVAKAKEGAVLSGLPLGLGSEGTFGPNPWLPFIASDVEHVALVDLERGLVLVESASSLQPRNVSTVAAPGDPLDDFLRRADFPRHALVVMPDDRTTWICKGLVDHAELQGAIRAAAQRSANGRAVIQSDLRAHCSPSRQAVISQAVEKLARRIASLCPACSAPGWAIVERRPGLVCKACGSTETTAVRADVYGCAGCDHQDVVARPEPFADPGTCLQCNP